MALTWKTINQFNLFHWCKWAWNLNDILLLWSDKLADLEIKNPRWAKITTKTIFKELPAKEEDWDEDDQRGDIDKGD